MVIDNIVISGQGLVALLVFGEGVFEFSTLLPIIKDATAE